MKHEKKFSSEEQRQISETQSQQTAAREFGSVEELLRFDAKQTVVPPAVAAKLGRSLRREPVRSQSWWQRWFGSQ